MLALYALLLPVSVAFAATLTANAVVSRWFVRRLGLALGLTSFGLGLAGVVLPPIVAAVIPYLGWRLIWRFCGLLIAVIAVPLVLWIVRDLSTDARALRRLRQQPCSYCGGPRTLPWLPGCSRTASEIACRCSASQRALLWVG
jgi:MFS family permease